MKQERIAQLRTLKQENPEDPFYTYALGLEYVESEPERAQRYFIEVNSYFPKYLPVYYPLASLLAESDPEKSKRIFSKGIELAAAQGDTKAASELRSALTNWELEWEGL